MGRMNCYISRYACEHSVSVAQQSRIGTLRGTILTIRPTRFRRHFETIGSIHTGTRRKVAEMTIDFATLAQMVLGDDLSHDQLICVCRDMDPPARRRILVRRISRPAFH